MRRAVALLLWCLAWTCVVAAVSAVPQESVAATPAPIGEDVDAGSGGRTISVAISLTKQGRAIAAPMRPASTDGKKEDVEEAHAAEYFATYDVTDVSRFYTADTSGTKAAMDYRTAVPTRADNDSSEETESAEVDQEGKEKSGKALILEARKKAEQKQKEEEEAAEQAEAQAEAEKKETVRRMILGQLPQAVKPPTDEATSNTEPDTTVTSQATAPSTDVVNREQMKKTADALFQSAQVAQELTPFNAHFYAHQNLPFALFLRCDCPDDYLFASQLEALKNLLVEARTIQKVLLLWVAPQWREQWQLGPLFGLALPLEATVGSSVGSNQKAVYVKFPPGIRYDSAKVEISNECCGDKFRVETKNLTPEGVEVHIERYENSGAPGWGQFLKVRVDGEPEQTSRYPAFVIDNLPMGANNEKFVYPPGPITAQGLATFLHSFLDMILPPTIRSQALPLSPPVPTPGQVLDVYGESFTSVVLDPTKDVVVLIYAPWCGGSQAVMPLFVQLAEALVDEPNVLITQMDKTANDFPIRGIRVTHYPTVLLFPVGDYQSPDYRFLDYDDYNGSKENHRKDVPHSHFSLDNLVQFVKDKDSRGSGSHFHLTKDLGELHDRNHKAHQGHTH